MIKIVFWVNFGVTIVATLYFGWHYIADDVAGVLIALLAFYLGGMASGQKFERHSLQSHPTTTTSAIPVESRQPDRGQAGRRSAGSVEGTCLGRPVAWSHGHRHLRPRARPATAEDVQPNRSRRATSSPTIDVPALAATLDGRYAEVRDLVRTQPGRARLDPRGRGDAQPRRVSASGSRTSPSRWPRPDRPAWASPRNSAAEATSAPRWRPSRHSPSATSRCWSRWASSSVSSVARSCSSAPNDHHAAYLPDLITGKLMGCFAMTETGHGCNVQALGTVATYDVATEEFVIATRGDVATRTTSATPPSTPSWRWCSPSSRSGGKPGCARLRRADPGERRGRSTASGSRTTALKMGLNGVDNGRLWFDGVRVPRDAPAQPVRRRQRRWGLQQRHRERRTGASSPCSGTLVQGRVCVGGAGINAAKVALTIAIKYAERAPPVRGDRRRARRSCCSTTACTSSGSCRCWRGPTPCTSPRRSSPASCTTCSPGRPTTSTARRELESRAAGTKALGTWHATRTIQECREACGGAGYLAVNRFAALKADTDVFTTFEGDNHVLLQLVAKGLLTDYSSEFAGHGRVRDGAVRRRPGGRDGDREDQRPQAARADQGRAAGWRRRGTRRPACSTPSTSSRCCASARNTCSAGSPVG